MTDAAVPSSVLFRAILQPHRSLSRPAFRVLMAVLGLASFVIGTLFLWHGAWPVFGYFGLDVLAVYLAFRASYRSARAFEQVELTETELTVRREQPSRPPEVWSFQPYWLRVAMDDPPRHDSQVTLSSHGRHLIVGRFLSPDERLDFALALRDALRRLRLGLRPLPT
jgi:uncharacterized membrane protein